MARRDRNQVAAWLALGMAAASLIVSLRSGAIANQSLTVSRRSVAIAARVATPEPVIFSADPSFGTVTRVIPADRPISYLCEVQIRLHNFGGARASIVGYKILFKEETEHLFETTNKSGGGTSTSSDTPVAFRFRWALLDSDPYSGSVAPELGNVDDRISLPRALEPHTSEDLIVRLAFDTNLQLADFAEIALGPDPIPLVTKVTVLFAEGDPADTPPLICGKVPRYAVARVETTIPE